MSRLPLIVILNVFFFYCACSQTSSDKLISELYQLWDGEYTGYKLDHLAGEVENSFDFFEYSDSINSQKTSEFYSSQIKKAEAAQIKKDWGLDWNTGYAINSANGVDVSDNILYRSRIQTELSWNILNNGFFENRTRSDIKLNESLIAELEENQSPEVTNLYFNWHSIIYAFNVEKIDILNKRLSLAKSRVDVAYKLNAQALVTQEELLKNLESFAEIKSLLNIYDDYNKELNIKIDSILDYPLIDINYDYALQNLEIIQNDSLKQLYLQNLDLKNKAINDINLRAYSRYNYYDLIAANVGNRSFLTFGLSVGIPLVFDRKETAQIKQLQQAQIEVQKPETSIEQQKDILGFFYEFRYKLKQFNSFYYKRLMLEELLRKEQARHQINQLDFNPLKALRLLDEMMSVDIELIDLKQQLYLYVLRIHSAKPHLEISKLIKPLSLEEIEINQKSLTSMEVYVWSKTLEEYGSSFLLNLLQLQNINKVIVSTGGDRKKLANFMNDVGSQGIEIDLMIGDNGLLENFQLDKFKDKLIFIDMSQVAGIHLDIEPHTFDDWKLNKEEYIAKYIEMVTLIKKECDITNLKLAVSIPTHYPEEMVKSIYGIVDKVYFMCYENVDTDFIVKKIGKYDMTKTVIALRTEDFENKVMLGEKMEELKNNLNPNSFVIHDLGRLIKLE